MKLEFTLCNAAMKASAILLAIVVCGALTFEVLSAFVVGTLTDERVKIGVESLEAASHYFPNSARLHSRLAELTEQQGDLSLAESHMLRAFDRSPYNYKFAVTLASIEESRGDYERAEQSLHAALKLAPNTAEVHWNLANLLLRRGELGDSLDEFRAGSALKRSLLPSTLNLIWRASNESIEALESVTSDDATSRITLARFLLNHSRPVEAALVFDNIDRRARLASAECAALLNALIASNHLELARSLWAGTVEETGRVPDLISNGSFESDRVDGFSQFDWIIKRSDYAKVSISKSNPRTGARSLRLDFSGRDTTRLDNEIQQLVVVRPRGRYRIECYAKPEGLVTSEGPRIVVTTGRSSEWLASSEPVAAGSSDWQHLATDFTAPDSADGGAVGVYVSIKRKPKFSYDEPTRGRIYFDDFTLSEQVALAGASRQARATK